jgi:hypothetical protein
MRIFSNLEIKQNEAQNNTSRSTSMFEIRNLGISNKFHIPMPYPENIKFLYY